MTDSTSVGMRWHKQREFSINRGIRRFFGGRDLQRMTSWTLCLRHLYQVALGGIGLGPEGPKGVRESLCVLSRNGFRGYHSSFGSYRNRCDYCGRYAVDAEVFYERDKEGGGSRWNVGSNELAMARSFLFPFASATYPHRLSTRLYILFLENDIYEQTIFELILIYGYC